MESEPPPPLSFTLSHSIYSPARPTALAPKMKVSR